MRQVDPGLGRGQESRDNLSVEASIWAVDRWIEGRSICMRAVSRLSSNFFLRDPPFPGVCFVSPFRLFLRHALNFVHICFPDRSDSHSVLSLLLLTSGTPPPQWRLLYAIAFLSLRLLFRQLKSETDDARDAISITVADTVAYGSGATAGRIPHGSISTP